MPEPSVDICIGALPAATFKTVKEEKCKEEKKLIHQQIIENTGIFY